MITGRPSTPHGDDRGVVAVEFALVAPLLVALVFTVFIAMSVYVDKLHLESAARNAARIGSVSPGSACDAARSELSDDNLAPVQCDIVSTCPGGNVTVELAVHRDYSIPVVGNRSVTLHSSSTYTCRST